MLCYFYTHLCLMTPNTSGGWWGRYGEKTLSSRGGRKGGWRKKAKAHEVLAGPGRTRDLPRAWQVSPAASHRSCLDK